MSGLGKRYIGLAPGISVGERQLLAERDFIRPELCPSERCELGQETEYRQGVPEAAHYAAAKAYVQSLAEGLQRELAPLSREPPSVHWAGGPQSSQKAD